MGFRIGVDIGGTFTDAVAIAADGREITAKALSTPGNLSAGVLASVAGLAVELRDVETFVHGTTAGVNAFLERRGARVALVTTAGFRDVYEIGRANRPAMYDVRYKPPTPLVRRRDVYEVSERVTPDGVPLTPLDEVEVRDLGARLTGRYDSVAVVLLHGYANPAHERAVKRVLIEQSPELTVLCSHEVAAQWREYERTSTTVVSAYIAPIVEEYLGRLDAELAERGSQTALRVMQSNGGLMTAAIARSKPIQTLLSGPVGGTVAGVEVAATLGLDRLICVDMGGTSFDVSLVVDGTAEVEAQATLEGHPLLAPTVTIHTVGAGGGSVAYVEAGALRVGPRSAGAVPGPACYRRGGAEPTVTDANVVLGRLPGAARLGGELELDIAAAEAAIDAVAEPLGLDRIAAARGIVSVADAAMANAIREITVSRGIDPRDFSLLAFGGAGPLHAVALAEELSIPRVVVPANPGVLSAWGMLHTDTRHDLVQSFFVPTDELAPAALTAAVEELCARGRSQLHEDGVAHDAMELVPAVDLRYVGQEYSVTVPWALPEDPVDVIASLPGRFAEAHLDRYGHNNPGESVECVNLRVTALGRVEKVPARTIAAANGTKPVASTSTYFDGGWRATEIYRRDALGAGAAIAGPAVVLEDACTILIPPGWGCAVSEHGHLLVERVADGA
jgi:N-methylhydantoinase A